MKIEQCSNDSFWVKEEIQKEMKDFLEFNENEGTTYSILWVMKVELRRKTMCLQKESGEISHLAAHLKALEKKQSYPGEVYNRK